MQVIPAIDIFQGKCVRLAEGEYDRKKDYDVLPKDKALEFREAGAKRLHVVDLEGAKEGRIVNWEALREILSAGELDVQIGGGVRSSDDVKALRDLGAARVVVGSMAVREPQTVEAWTKEFGPETFCIALDIKDGQLATNGWQSASAATLDDIIGKLSAMGIKDYLSTDIRRDGMMSGPNFQLYHSLTSKFGSLRWLASGGVRSLDDIEALKPTGVAGVIVGKAIYERQIELKQLFKSRA